MRAAIDFKWKKFGLSRWRLLVAEFAAYLGGYLGGVYFLLVSNEDYASVVGTVLLGCASVVNLRYASAPRA